MILRKNDSQPWDALHPNWGFQFLYLDIIEAVQGEEYMCYVHPIDKVNNPGLKGALIKLRLEQQEEINNLNISI